MRADALVGQTLASRYRVEAKLGEGAMGTVFRAEHVKVGRAFAVKVLHPRMLENKKFRRRFEREAELAGRLRHRNVIGVVDVGVTPDGYHFIVMEFGDGPTLAHLIGQPMEAERVISIAQQLCDGLQHAHEHGLIHRDFKPENIIVERDQYGAETPRILDFGIAIQLDEVIQLDDRERLTTAGMVLGTPHYMAPEHATGAAIDHRIDLFALGVICYEMLTGRLPFDGDGVDVARANLCLPTPPMGVRVPMLQVDPLLEAFTRALMVKSRDARLPSARAARELLDLIQRDRAEAAVVLGIEPEPAAPPIAASQAPALPGRAASPKGDAEWRSTGRAITLDPEPLPTGAFSLWTASAPAIQSDIEPTPMQFEVTALAQPAIAPPTDRIAHVGMRSRGRLAAVAAIATAVAVLAMIAFASNGESAPTSAAAPRFQPALEPPATTLPAPRTAPPAAPQTAAKPAPAPAVAKPQPAPVAIAAPAPRAATETPVHELTNQALADLYTNVGRSLRRLEMQGGDDATSDLWPRFRFIRINEAFASRAKRIAANDALVALQRDIGTRLR